MIDRIVSGGQTGVDRAALDVALELGLPCGGWCPKGRRAEDGMLDARYPLRETPSDEYLERTEWNVRDSDATLILNRGALTGGTAQTLLFAHRLRKPCLIIGLSGTADPSGMLEWVERQHVRTLNVAGPRESKSPGVYEASVALMRRLLNAATQRRGEKTE